MSVKLKTISGVKWLVGSSFVQKILSFGTMIVLARILAPSDFGLFALAFIAIDALGLFKSMGIDTALVRRKQDVSVAADTAFFIIPSLGIVMFIIMFFSAPYISGFLGEEKIVNILRVLGFIFIFNCFGKVPAALLEKKMEFKSIIIREILASLLYSLTSIVLAVLGFGVWSLVAGYTVRSLVQAASIWVLSRWRPTFCFDKKIALQMFHFGKFLFLSSLVWFLRKNLDNLLVGKMIGITALGFYAIAFNISNFCVDYFGNRVHRVVFPAFSHLREDEAALRAAVLKTFKFTCIFALPFGAIMMILPYDLIGFIYGAKWLEAAKVLRILAWAGIFNTLPTSLSPIFLVKDKSHYKFIIDSVQVLIFVALIVPSARNLGMVGVGLVVTLASFVAFALTAVIVMKETKIKLSEFWGIVKFQVCAVSIMGILVILLRQSLILSVNLAVLKFFQPVFLATVAVGLYFSIVFALERQTFFELRSILIGK